MKFLKELLTGGAGGLIEKGLDFVNKRWPPDMSEEQRTQMEIVVKDMLHQQNMDLMRAAAEDEKLFNERTIALEGTAKDLAALPWVGSVVIFLRGAFRPLFAYFTLYADYVYLIEGMSWTERQETLLLAINLLVLVFFFGERAMKNVMPLIVKVFAAKNDRPVA
jgi:hypothetical protein